MKTAALLEKYCKPGPRYTSYPPAPHFHSGFTDADWQAELLGGKGSGRDLSLYVHIPFCDTLCWYCGCNMVATRDYSRAERYLDLLFREIATVGEMASPAREVKQLHWGGGTPTFLRSADMERLLGQLRSCFKLAEKAEIGCEADPRELSRDQVQTLKALGFNRISLGVQDLNEQVQVAVNRVQPESLIREVYGWMRAAGFDSVNMDLMVGLPHQTVAGFSETLEAVVEMRPDRLAVFSYAHVPWMKRHQKLIPESALPDFQTRIALQELIVERLAAAGYVHIGMDHHALPGDELVAAQLSKSLNRNFQGYTTYKNCDILGFGVTAISQTADVYAQNLKKIPDYRDRIKAGRLGTERGLRVSDEDKLRRDAITCIMCDLELNLSDFGRRWGIDCDRYFGNSEALLKMEADGLLEVSGDVLKVTGTGRLFLRNIAMLFDGYCRSQGGNESLRYSRTV